MIYFVTANGVESTTHVHCPCPVKPEDVTEVQADGDELELIRNEMSGIPMSRGRIVRWFGDDAKFIAANWD